MGTCSIRFWKKHKNIEKLADKAAELEMESSTNAFMAKCIWEKTIETLKKHGREDLLESLS